MNPIKNNLKTLLIFAATGYILLVVTRGVPASAATLFFEHPDNGIAVGQQFEVVLRLDPQGKDVNAVEGKILLPQNLKIIGINDGDSIVSLWIQRPKEENGGIIFSGIIPGGYRGTLGPYWQNPKSGEILKLLLKSKSSGGGQISLGKARVLLNDGEGTEVPLSISNLALVIKEGGTGVGAGMISYKDTTPPESFTPQVVQDPNVFSGKWFLVFVTRDTASGIDHYEILEKPQLGYWKSLLRKTNWVVGDSPYLLRDQNLKSSIFVKAVDRQGNQRIEKLEPRNSLSWYENYFDWFIIIISIVLIYLAYRMVTRSLKRWYKT